MSLFKLPLCKREMRRFSDGYSGKKIARKKIFSRECGEVNTRRRNDYSVTINELYCSQFSWRGQKSGIKVNELKFSERSRG